MEFDTLDWLICNSECEKPEAFDSMYTSFDEDSVEPQDASFPDASLLDASLSDTSLPDLQDASLPDARLPDVKLLNVKLSDQPKSSWVVEAEGALASYGYLEKYAYLEETYPESCQILQMLALLPFRLNEAVEDGWPKFNKSLKNRAMVIQPFGLSMYAPLLRACSFGVFARVRFACC